MKTLLLAPELFATDSGIPRILRLYLKALCDLAGENDSVRLVALNDSTIDSADFRHYANKSLAAWISCSRDKKKFVRSTLRFSRGTQLIICGHVAQLPVAWLARLLNPGLRYMLVAHGIEVWRPFGFWERRALKGAHRILCVSEFTRTELLKNVRLDPRRLVVLPNALDPTLEQPVISAASFSTNPATAPATPPVILTVSRLAAADSYKGIDHLIMALPYIRTAIPEAKLRIVGRGDDAPRLQSLVRELDLGDAVEFAGFVSDEQLPREFAACTLFALPSQKEGFGLVYLEAMAAGKPCLAANEGGAPEVVTPDCGRLVPYGDIDAIAAVCTEMLVTTWNPDTIARHMRQCFSFDVFRQNLMPLLSR